MIYQPDEEAIRKRAYEIWEARGRTGGHEADDWCEAERQMIAARASAVNSQPDVEPLIGTSPAGGESKGEPSLRKASAAKRISAPKRK